LYESILDDENDVLNRLDKYSNNWLLMLKNAMINNNYSEDIINDIISQDNVRKLIKPIFKQFDGRMNWLIGQMKYGTYVILQDTKERSKFGKVPVISFIFYNDNNKLTINVSKFNKLTKTAQKNVNENELLKFKQRLMELGAEYSKTGTGKVCEDILKI
jgi:hypothetical protein